MNEQIELVKKWLADNDSVTQKELNDNRSMAYAAYSAAYTADAYAYVEGTAEWVKRYEELKGQE
jgi:hypothetical protein|tara:strand:+ start:205 stop:396 length:192 start_codon:yes stop_codon:yes gene_type:complete